MRAFSNFECQKRFKKMLEEEDSSSENKKRECDNSSSGTNLFIVGIGPGGKDYFTLKAVSILNNVDVIITYKNYLPYIEEFLENKEVYSTGMKQEIARCEKAIEMALQGKKVAVVSTGDAGIYGMAGLILELLENKKLLEKIKFEVVPGVSAFNAAASIIGAPVMHDFAVISLSDLLTPWDVIIKRIEYATKADFVLNIYNPSSKKRIRNFVEAINLILKFRDEKTPVAIVKNALRNNQNVKIVYLKDVLDCEVDMFSVVLIGNSQSRIVGERFILTPRGYKL